jgi:hypothetical protein
MTLKDILERQSEAEGCLDALLEVESGLTQWETTFIESLNKQRKDAKLFSPRQLESLTKLYDDQCQKGNC